MRCDLRRASISCLSLLAALFGNGCIQSHLQPEVPTSTSTALSVTISPQSLELKRGASTKFSAVVANANDTTVTWSIHEGSAGGAITDAGVYTAPSVDGVYQVIATSKADPTKIATATVSVGASAFTLTGDLSSGRFSHTATRIPSGQVLVVGGVNTPNTKYVVVDRTEQYDPTMGTFQSIGTFARHCHSATLLANGDILLAGGATDPSQPSSSVSTASAELLKSGTGVLQPTGSMSIPRCDHTATLLQDGRVLIAGGATDTAELYDPASGTFAPAGKMSEGQSSQTATLLLNGKVLIVGFGSADVYDPATNAFTATNSSPAQRFEFTATLLRDGRVLIAGGETYYDFLYLGPSELFDPATGQFTPAGNLTITRWGHTATLLPDGTVLLAGGVPDASNVPTNTTEIYYPATGSFSLGPKMMRARVLHTATLLFDGSVLLAGGWWANNADWSAEIYK